MLGGLWYSKVLFGKVWQEENKLSDDELKKDNGKVFGLCFIWAIIMSLNLAMFLSAPEVNLAFGIFAGLAAGLGWVAMAIFTIGLFERKSWRYMLVNAGYMILSFALMGAILGGWR